jgi:hypothetical protein
MQTANCERCGRALRVAESRREDSKPFRLAKVPKGVCPECVMTQFLYNTYPINQQIDEAGPELLLKPLVAECFRASGLLDDCDLKIEEIDWARLVANWKLPVKVTKGAKNCYTMGESRARRQRLAEIKKLQEQAESDVAAALGGEDKSRQESILEQLRKQRTSVF